MRQIKIVTALVLFIIGSIGLGSAAYLELIVIPVMLSARFGQYATLLHLGTIGILLASVYALAVWMQRRAIFSIQERLVNAALVNIISAIDNLTTGRWSADSYSHREAYKTGARLGYDLGKRVVDNVVDVDRQLVVEGLARMQQPHPRQAIGQTTVVVEEMNGFMTDLATNKRQLAE